MISEIRLQKVATRLVMAGLFLCVTAPFSEAQSENQGASPSAQSLDFASYKTGVEPIFMKRRADRARCFVCHAGSTNRFRLEKLSPGSSTWTEEQSRQNFQFVSQLVVPGDPNASRLLMHPLAPEAGGDANHNGGRQFESQNDPDWQTLAAWVRGQKGSGSSRP